MKARLRIAIGAIAVALLAANALFVIRFKAQLDKSSGLCVLAEEALRAGKLKPDELTFAPFGYVGWHLFPYYIAHEGKTTDAIADFAMYLHGSDVQVASQYSRSLRKFEEFNRVAPSDKRDVFGFHHVRFLWLYEAQYYLLRMKPPAEQRPRAFLGSDFEHFHTLFPLDDAEWRSVITPGR